MRPIWRGSITFGLVSVPVRLFSAVENRAVHFNLLHEKDGERVHYKRVCDKGHEVDWDDIVRGYEYKKGEYVTFTDDELDALQVESLKTIDIVNFVSLDEIDPIFYDRSYYVVPEEAGLKAYKLLSHALEESGSVGVAKVALRDKEHLSTLRLSDGVFVLETMHWPDEIRAADFDELDKRTRLTDQEKKMARSLIEQLTGPFDPDQFQDEFRKEVKKLARKKAEGKEITVPSEPEEERGEVVDLMEALQASVKDARSKRRSSRPTSKKSTKRKKSDGRKKTSSRGKKTTRSRRAS